MRLSYIPVLILLMPLAEIATFLFVGKLLGVWTTLALIILSSLIGLSILRMHGAHALQRASSSRSPYQADDSIIRNAIMILVGLLLLIPGFLTDLMGILLMIPAVRGFVWARMNGRILSWGSRAPFSRAGTAARADRPQSSRERVVELDDTEFHREPDKNSPWAGRGNEKQ